MKNSIQLMVLLLFVCAQVMWPLGGVDEKSSVKIDEILRGEKPVISLDMRRKDEVFSVIDSFFMKNGGLKGAKRSGRDSDSRECLILQTSSNVPVGSAAGVKSSGPFTVRYVKKTGERKFLKTVRVLTEKKLDDKDAEAIALKFINSHKLCSVSEIDKPGKAQVLARKTAIMGKDGRTAKEYVLKQRVIFSRVVSGLKVINSKQIVDIHPDTGEILAFKSIGWIPVDSSRMSRQRYVSKESLVASINGIMGKSRDKRKISDISPAYMQADGKMFPVVVCRTELVTPDKRGPVKLRHVVPLIKGLKRAVPDRKVKMPKEMNR